MAPQFRVTNRSWQSLAQPIILIFLAVATYAGGLHTPFIYDDDTEVVQNGSIRDLSNVAALLRHSITRPVTNLSYAIDYRFWQLDPFGYHLTNLLLHVIDVLLIFAFARALLRDRRQHGSPTQPQLAFATAAIFCVHPVMTEAVAYVSGRADLLAAAFSLASLLAFRRAMVHGGKVSLLAGFVCFGLGLGSKETAIMVPVVLLAYDGLILGAQRPADSARRVSWGLHASLLALLLVAAAARSILFVFVEQHANAGFNWRHVLVDVDVLAQYVSLIVLPLKQSFVHAVTPTASAFLRGLAIVGIVAAIAIRVRRSQPLVSFGLVWSVAWLLPGLGLILLANVGVPMAERRAYLSVFGLVLAVVVALDDWWQQSRLQQKTRVATAYVALTIVIVGLAGLTAQRLRLWADPVLLWSDAVVKAPGTWMAQFGLADAYQTVGDCEAALAPYTRAITLVPQNAQAYDGLAGCLTELHRSDEARDVLRTAVQRIPDAAQARVTLAGLEAAANHRAEAVRLCAEVQALAPGTREAATCVWR